MGFGKVTVMKAFLIALFLAANSYAGPTARIGWHFYTDATAFLGGSTYDCTNNGTVTFATVNGFQCALFDNTTTKYFGGSAALTTFINANKAQMQVEVHVQKITNSGTDGLWFWGFNSGGCAGDLSLYSSTATPFLQDPDAASCTGPTGGTVSTTAWKTLIYSQKNGLGYLYVDGVQVGVAVATTSHGTIDVAAEFGRYTSSFPMDGYLRDVIISNGDVCTGTTCLPYNPSGSDASILIEDAIDLDLEAK